MPPVRLADGRYFDGPITPRLLGVLEDEPDGMARLLESFDVLEEVEQWVEGEPVTEWTREHRTGLILRFWNPKPEDLARYTDEAEILAAYRRELKELRALWTRAIGAEPSVMVNRVLKDPMQRRQARIGVAEIGRGRRTVIQPVSIIDRSLFELIEVLRRGLRPVICAYCGMPFPPARAGQRYCPGTDCRDRGNRQIHDRTAYRREYHRVYALYRRGRIGEKEWKAWRSRFPNQAAFDRGRGEP